MSQGSASKRTRRRRRLPLLALAVVVLGALGVGSLVGRASRPGPSAAASPRLTPGAAGVVVAPEYIATGPSYVDVLELSDRGGELKGALRVVQVSGSPPRETTITEAQAVVGLVAGSVLRLRFDGGRPVTGRISGGALAVTLTQADGTVRVVVLRPAGATQLRVAVDRLDAGLTTANHQGAR